MEQYFHVVLFIMLYKVTLTFEFVQKTSLRVCALLETKANNCDFP